MGILRGEGAGGGGGGGGGGGVVVVFGGGDVLDLLGCGSGDGWGVLGEMEAVVAVGDCMGEWPGRFSVDCCCCRSSFKILDDSGVTFGGVLDVAGFVSVFFAGSDFGDCVGGEDFETLFWDDIGLALGSGVGITPGEAFGVLVVAFVALGAVLGAALVDFALVVVFFAPAGTLTSTVSVMTFFGLPLFLATSEDMLRSELVAVKCCG